MDSDSRGQWSVDIQPKGGPISQHFCTLPAAGVISALF
jgi:hypothetical protein